MTTPRRTLAKLAVLAVGCVAGSLLVATGLYVAARALV